MGSNADISRHNRTVTPVLSQVSHYVHSLLPNSAMCNLLADGNSIGFSPIVLCDALVDSSGVSELPIVYQQKKEQWLETLKAEAMLPGEWSGGMKIQILMLHII